MLVVGSQFNKVYSRGLDYIHQQAWWGSISQFSTRLLPARQNIFQAVHRHDI